MRLLIGGSPCTHWSIAQTKNRETEPSGIGWELFENYLIARDIFRPDYFLYENNKSMSSAIREEITRRLGVEPICINSALVSAQNRQRLYWTNIPGVRQPEDRGILLRDILETWCAVREKAYALLTPKGGTTAEDAFARRQRNVVAQPVNMTAEGKAHCLRATYYKDGVRNMVGNTVDRKTCVAVPAGMAWRGHARNGNPSSFEMRADGKSNAVIVGHQNRLIIDSPAMFQKPRGFNTGGVKYEKAPTLTANGDWAHNNFLIAAADGKTLPIYEVRNGLITIKGKQYPIKLADGCYIIRKLTVRECMRLQTVPEWYEFPVSATQAYKMLGNGWTVDVIAHILSYCPGITTEPLDVLSMYDGMACGHLALDKLGAQIARYRATEIDKYAIRTACHNFPDIEQLGDAYLVRWWAPADW